MESNTPASSAPRRDGVHSFSLSALSQSIPVSLSLEEDLAKQQPYEDGAASNAKLSAERAHAVAANFKALQLTEQVRSAYRQIIIPEPEHDLEVCSSFQKAILLREKYLFHPKKPLYLDQRPPRPSNSTTFVPPPYDPFAPSFPSSSKHVCVWNNGCMTIYSDQSAIMKGEALFEPPCLWLRFVRDLELLMGIINNPDGRSLAHSRLIMLEKRFEMHLILNSEAERMEQMMVPHRDFFNIRKVDGHVHHSSSMTQKVSNRTSFQCRPIISCFLAN
mmetsp:Transcript_3883/g.6776  ORF Transcript_3883/g.6776 Transcript_3883/m.6776 type:complete len:275 (-) Transcript_3883:1733-2557(-)